MHRDVKLGLALGILVIGFAAAFCFPRQPATELPINPAAGLKLAAVDEEIRMQRRRSFVGDELTPPAQPTLAEPVADAVVNAELPPLQTAASRLQSELPAVPEPIRPEAGNAGASPSELVMASTGPPFAGAGESMPVEPPAAAEEIYYTVQPVTRSPRWRRRCSGARGNTRQFTKRIATFWPRPIRCRSG